MKFVFGPVPSRRLGQSLGIDPVPHKTCNWNCVYCQLGRTIPLSNKRQSFFPRDDLIYEVEQALNAHQPGEIDWVTFVGSGETLLNADLGWMIRQVKMLTDLPVAVITNGSLFFESAIRQELFAADAVLPSLDAGNPALYRKINRPHPAITFDHLIEGLIAFGEEYQGKLWIEVMLVSGLNDTEPALKEIAGLLERIRPDEVHILQPERPPAEAWIRPADDEGVRRARAILGDRAYLMRPTTGMFDLKGADSLLEAIIDIITRHPMREDLLVTALKSSSESEIYSCLADLERSGKVQVVNRLGARFWSAHDAHYSK